MTVPAIFALVYLGMLLGHIPGLRLDRTGVALLGALLLIVAGEVAPQGARDAVDIPTMALLFGLMIVSAQLRLGGFYAALTRRIALARLSPAALLALVIAVAGLLSALLVNDIVCLAMAPILVEGCARRRLAPLPFLLALACASNVGSAATLIGNPQNMLIGQTLQLRFAGYLLDAAVPAALGLGAVWLVVRWRVAGRWAAPGAGDDGNSGGGGGAGGDGIPAVQAPPLDRWQTAKGLAVLGALVLLFLLGDWPRELLALGAAALLLLSRRMASARTLALIDWPLLTLFAGLFIVNHALAESGALARGTAALAGRGVDLSQPAWLFAAGALLSNLVSNVPAVMLLLPSATHPLAGPVLALASTLAGNLFLVGSIANLIVAEQAGRLGVRIGWREHLRIGVPVTLATLAIAAAWLWLRAGMLAG
jgi:Na+/H+ antiporter NhaD/arsenite permease-like protein